MTPRRSSRARTSQPSSVASRHASSSGSSSSTSRSERNTRSNNKTSSRRSSAQRSQSTDNVNGGSKGDLPRRQNVEDDSVLDQELEHGEGEDDDGDEEEEITRCLCLQQDYPGLPPSRRNPLSYGLSPPGATDEAPANLPTDSSDLLSDDVGSMFIQCDSCKVWQHGGCVGIMDEAMSPEEYYCEECRKDLHKIQSEPDGRYSSQYLPVLSRSYSPTSSRSSSRESFKRARNSKLRSDDLASYTKRRSTMNSRDAAYDVEEQLEYVAEGDKDESKSTTEEIAKRRGKRSRSSSEANKETIKRQRTGSPHPPPPPKQSPPPQPASEDESQAKEVTNDVRKQRTARPQRKAEVKDVEEGDLERTENTSRRKGRTDRRKTEDSEQEAELPEKPVTSEPEQSQPCLVPVQESALSRPPTRKSGRPPARRGGKSGRNQHTRDRDINGHGTETHMKSPRRGQSNDMSADSPRLRSNGTHFNGGESAKLSKSRNVNLHRSGMTEMKRRVAGILEFISRMQVEMAVSGESVPTPPGNDNQRGGTTPQNIADQMETSIIRASGDGSESSAVSMATGSDKVHLKERDFKELTSVEMMDVLTRHLLKWQQEYGKFGEK